MAGKFLCRFSLIVFILFITVAHSEYIENDDCYYKLYVRTGTIANAGTDANVGISLYNENNDVYEIPDIIKWGGMMGPGHDYFENGNLDIFQGNGQCLNGYVCAMNLVSDDSGYKSGWYVDNVEVFYCRGDKCGDQPFDVHQWLATDEPPHQLFAYRNKCGSIKTSR